MLTDMAAPGHAERVAEIIEQSRRLDKVMIERPRVYDHLAPGEIARQTATKRGLLRPKLQALGSGVMIRHRRESCAPDWRKQPILGIPRHDLNLRPRFPLPYSGKLAQLSFRLVHPDRAALGSLQLACNDVPVTTSPTSLRPGLWGWSAKYRVPVQLCQDQPSALEFHLSPAHLRKEVLGPVLLGLGLGTVRLRPVA